MAPLMIEGFDHYAFADMGKKWSAAVGGSFSTATVRTGTQSLAFPTSAPPIKLFSTAEEHATFIVGFAMRMTSFGAASTITLLNLLGDFGLTTHVTLGMNQLGKLSVYRGTTVGTLLGSEAGTSIVTGAWQYIELKAVLHDTTGSVEVRVDGVAVITLTNQDTKNAGTRTTFDTVSLVFTGGQAFVGFIDDLYICNGAGSLNNNFLGDVKVQTLYPTGAGNTTGLTPSTGANYDAVNEPSANTSDYVSSPTVTTKDTYVFGDLTVGYDPLVVQEVLLAQKVEAGAVRTAVPVTRSAGADYDGTAKTLPTGWVMHRALLETDPATAVAWTAAGVNAAEFGVKVG